MHQCASPATRRFLSGSVPTVRTFPWTGDSLTLIASSPGEVIDTPAFGLYQPTSHYISGVVFNDANGNGVLDRN